MAEPFYDDGQITIYNSDCRDVLPHIPTGGVDLVLTDPPYGVGVKYDNYLDTQEGYAQLIAAVFAEMRRIAPVVMLTTGMRNLWLYPPADWVACWAKPGSGRASGLSFGGRTGFNEWEPVLIYGKVHMWHDFFYLPDVQNHDSSLTGRHPCPKPLSLYLRLMQAVPGGCVVDPFMGSGTALVAAKTLGWRAIGIDTSEQYCQLAVDRLRQAVFMPCVQPAGETLPLQLWG